MAAKKKTATKAKAAPKPKPAPKPTGSGYVYYRTADGKLLFRVDAKSIPLAHNAKQDTDWDLEKVPEGEVSVWTGNGWMASSLPLVGMGPDDVRHTTNRAGKGVV